MPFFLGGWEVFGNKCVLLSEVLLCVKFLNDINGELRTLEMY